ncbi:MAG TPA: hypothetical protein VF183_05055, partial [Acidimicrobiales bacterium]
LGLVSAVTAVVYFVAVPLGVAGLVVGLFALRRRSDARRLALAGTLLSIVGLVVGLGVLTFLLIDDEDEVTSVVDGIESRTADPENPPQRDLHAEVRCQIEIDTLRAAGAVTNHTDEIADYHVLVVWERDGDRLAEAAAILERVAAAETREWEVTALGQGDSATSCRAIRVDRRPSDD